MKQRTKELCKDLIIALLLLSTIFLSLTTFYYSGSADTPRLAWLVSLLDASQSQPPKKAQEPALTDAAQPILISLHTGAGRATLWGSDSTLDGAYEALGGYLAEALDTAGEPQPISGDHFADCARGSSVYFRFPGSMPLPVLAAWLDASFGQDLSANDFLLVAEDGGVSLLLRDAAGCWSLETQMDPAALLAALESWPADGSRLAGECEGENFSHLDPMTPVISDLQSLPAAEASNPCEESFLTAAASVLGFNPYGDAGYRDDAGNTAYTESDSTLYIGADGTLILRNPGQAVRFSAASAGDGARIEYVRALVQALTEGRLGDARLQFTELQETDDGTQVEFCYFLSGLQVDQGGQAAVSARFTGAVLTELRFRIRAYSENQSETLPVLPAAQAAVLLDRGARLQLGYADSGDSALQAGWLQS